MELESLTQPELIFPELAGTDAASALWAFSELIAQLGVVRDAHQVYEKLLEREELGSTGIGSGVAIPHCKVKDLDKVVVAIGILKEAIDFRATDGLPVRVLFLVLAPEKTPAAHLHALAAISRWVQTKDHVSRIVESPDRDAVLELLRQGASEGTGVK